MAVDFIIKRIQLETTITEWKYVQEGLQLLFCIDEQALLTRCCYIECCNIGKKIRHCIVSAEALLP